MIKKQMYESPEVELLEVRLNRTLLSGSDGTNSSDNDYDSDNDLGEI